MTERRAVQILTLVCQDRVGIVAAVSGALAGIDGFILDMEFPVVADDLVMLVAHWRALSGANGRTACAAHVMRAAQGLRLTERRAT